MTDDHLRAGSTVYANAIALQAAGAAYQAAIAAPADANFVVPYLSTFELKCGYFMYRVA